MAEEQDNTEEQPRSAEEAAAALEDTPAGTVVEYEGETCSNCKHQLQLQCQLLPSGKNVVKANGRCSRWE